MKKTVLISVVCIGSLFVLVLGNMMLSYCWAGIVRLLGG